MSRSQDEIPPPPPPPPPPSSSQTSTQQTPHTVSTIKLPILKKREYDIWAMKMEHYLAYTNYPIWEVIQNGNGPPEKEKEKQGHFAYGLPEISAKFHKMNDQKRCGCHNPDLGGFIKAKKVPKSSESIEIIEHVYPLRCKLEILRFLHSAWSQVSLIMRTKPGVDSLNFDDLYNNLRVFENDVKGSIASSSSTQNVAFVSENTSSTNDVSTTYSISNPSGQNSQCEQTSSYSLLANQSSCPQLDHEDLEQLDEYDLEEMDLKWRECRRSGKQEDSKALVTIDGEGVDWTSHSEEEEDYALMACNSSGSDTEIDLDDKTDVLTYHKKLLAETMKEKEDLKAKLEKWHNSSKNLCKLINTQMSANDKFGLGYGDHRYDVILSYENEVLQSVFKGKESDFKNSPLYDRFVTAGGMNVSQPSESETQTSEFDTCESNISTETPELVSEPVVNTARTSGTKNVSTARHSFNRQAVLTSAAMKVNTVKPIVNRVRPTTIFHKTYSLFSRPFNKTTALRTNFSKQKVNTAKVNAVSAVGGKRETAIKPSAIRDHKDTTGTMSPNTMVYPHRALQNKGIVDSGCSRHMTGNKAYLAEYQDFNGGLVTFGGSKGYITGKGKGPTWLFNLDYLTDSINYQPVRTENQANKHVGPQEANQNAGTKDNIDAVSEEPTKHPDFKQVDKEDQVFLDEFERLKRQEQVANDAAEALRKEFAPKTKDLLLQAGAAKASSTNIVNTASTPVSTANPYGGLSFTDLATTDQDDSKIPALEEIYDNPTDGIFINSSYDDEGAVVDFTNLET
ncbi:hypothetical protein Tco_0135001, partial [Tanacetum coccineum]